MTETACDEKTVIPAETVLANERIVERKTIVYETRVDPVVISARYVVGSDVNCNVRSVRSCLYSDAVGDIHIDRV